MAVPVGGSMGGEKEEECRGEEEDHRIKGIEFEIFGDEDIKKVSALEIVERNLYTSNPQSDKRPLPNGVLDTRLGISDRKLECQTCKGRLTDCAGHFGFVRLELPVFHIGYFKHVLSILQCVCKECSRILVPEVEKVEFQRIMGAKNIEVNRRNATFKKLIERCKRVKVCQVCQAKNGSVKKVPNHLKISHDKFHKDEKSKKQFLEKFNDTKNDIDGFEQHANKATENLNCLRVWEIFKRIRPEDRSLLNIRVPPEKLLMTHIPVPPVCIRPSIEMEMSSATNEDDITMKLIQIVEVNNSLRQSIEKGLALTGLMEHWDFLQMQCAMYINSEAPGLPPVYHPHTKPLRGFVQRLKGKQGRFRGNLSGKRVDFSGRTVITPDPNLSIDEVGIPEHVAKALTYPERVTRYNIEKLRKCVNNGINVHPGACFVIAKNGKSKTYLKYGNKKKIAEGIQIGDVIERHLEDGDIVLFNRQPSLHKMSIMAHRVRVMPWRTFRFNECVCTPYNADFDGDEMNLHVPQTEEARTEALVLMSVSQNLCSPKSGELIVSAIQDFLTCSHLITKKSVFFDRTEFTRLACFVCEASSAMTLPSPAILKPVELWTGKQLFSMIVRETMSSSTKINLELPEKIYSKKDKSMCAVDGWVIIRESQLICGNLGKATLGTGSKEGLFALLIRDYSPTVSMVCMNRLAKLSSRWLGMFGFSIGIDDVTPGHSLVGGKEETVNRGYSACQNHIDLYNDGELELAPGCDKDQTLEVLVSSELNQIREEAGKMCIKELNPKNSALIMAQCGSKGSPLNISQMVACVGQQNVNGQRIENGFKNRTLPHFGKHTKSPNSKGFVKSSFFDGMSPTEFFFHTMAGREGLVDTAVKTAETGYMSRRLMKALEDLATRYDNTVRTCNGVVIQFTYGDDSLDPVEVEEKDGNPVNFERILNLVRTRNPSNAKDSLLPQQIKNAIRKATSNETLLSGMGSLCTLRETLDKGEVCSAFQHWVERKMHTFIDEEADKLAELRETWNLGVKKKSMDKKNVGKEYLLSLNGLSQAQIDDFVSTCFSKYERELVEPGTAVGAVAAHSIGEPGTQMTLKTFHFAGVASMNVTLGVPRLKEIINASKSVSTPIMDVYLDDSKSLESARIVKGRLERTTLGEISSDISSVLGPSGAYISITLDERMTKGLELDAGRVVDEILKLPKLKLKEKNIDVRIDSKIRVYPTWDEDEKNMLFRLHHLLKELPKVIVQGINTVERAVIKNNNGEYNLVVEGLDLKKVLGTAGVDHRETKSNHIIEVEKTLGIEAARNSIIHEIVYTMSEHGITVDRRHVMLLADLMTNKGEVLGITRFGIAKMKDSVLMLASFEKTTDHLFNAALHGRRDDITGVSECIILGRPMPLGTGHAMSIKHKSAMYKD
ncbi:DNA-directed RNA polymerase [Chloropicon primus]|uniref:DNA-directed RNA polymerase subunit n=2 Tax=Chloropicon primus TaxID=1764295 RepID=A0A5B8N1E2_9CHLO|nr:DNA-directed RNA polymerase [Chloropicon primus]UPR04891.1 DNA-directed RNA polymerase [Chloropicon primus]|eukprot:QDZ25695.1 DNA-directed RNA polymerase [Chloropicon primus]